MPKLHPVTKILALSGGLVLLVAFNDPVYLSVITAAAVLVGLFFCRAGGHLVRAVPFFLVFTAASLVIWPPFVRSGAEWFSLGGFVVTSGGATYALAMGIRIIGTVVVAINFAASTSPEEFAHGLRAMKVPPAVSFAISLAFRLLPVMAETTSRVVEAQKARGVTFSGGLIRRIKRYLPIIAPVILLNLRGADQMALALELRGFAPSRRPVPHNPPVWTAYDTVVIAVILTAVGAAVTARALGHGAVIIGRI